MNIKINKEVRRIILKGSILCITAISSVMTAKFGNNNDKFNEYKIEKEDLNKVDLSNLSVSKVPRITFLETDIEPQFPGLADETIYQNEMDLIKEYSNVFGLNSTVVLNKIKEYTNNFSNYEWLNSYKITNDQSVYSSEEASILFFIKDLSNNPNNYDLTYEELASNQEYQTEKSCEELVEKYSNLFGVKKEIVMSIIYTESGYNLDSYNFRSRNNPAGAGHTVYKNLEVGIIYHVLNLKNNYCSYDLNSSSFFSQAQHKYCPDNDGRWIVSNQYFYERLEEDFYSIYNENNSQKILTK